MIELLLRLTRRPPDGPTADCEQCGRTGADVLRVSAGRMRCSCRSCGAVFVARALRPVAAPPPVAAPRSAPALEGFVPHRMLTWLRTNVDPAELVDDPDRKVLYDWYARYDDFVRRARTSPKTRAQYDAVSEVPLEHLPERLPSFGHLVETLHGTCYDTERALGILLVERSDDEYLRERLAHAARWLASSGARYRWIDDADEPSPDVPDRAAVRALLDPGALTGPRDWDRNRLLTGALFGTERGPSPSSLLAQFSAEGVEQALRAYVEDGSRPLRATVLASVRAAA